MITSEEEQNYNDRAMLRRIKENMPEKCKNCTMWKITNLREQKVHCPYMLTKCILER